LATPASPAPPLAPPEDFEVLEFEVLEEDWNKYELEDYTLIKARLIPTRIERPKRGPAAQVSISATPIFSVFAQKRGPRGETPPQETWQTLEKIPVKIITSSEPWNKYRIPKTGDVIQVKLIVSEVFRVKDKFDNFGEPFYILTHSQVVSPVTKGSTTLKF